MKASMVFGMMSAVARTSASRISGKRLRPGWSFKFEAFARAMKKTESEVRKLDPAVQGAAWSERTVAHPILKKVRFEPAEGIDGEWVIPNDDDGKGRVILYLHGGWYSSNSPRNFREMMARLTTEAKTRAFLPDYRLAPQHPFPAAIDDTLAAWRWLREKHDDIVVAGDSAGGGLTAALILKLRDAGEPLPKRAAFICPWVDLSAESGSMIEHEPFDWSDRSEVFKRVKLYLGDRDPKTPLASPVYADLHGFPPSLVQIGGAEMLLDQAVAFADKLKRDGSPVTLEITPDMIHDWHMFAALFPEGRAAIARVAEFLRQ
jgi:epsilon-lactone hydrolase